MTQRRTLMACIAVLALAVTACGDDDGDDAAAEVSSSTVPAAVTSGAASPSGAADGEPIRLGWVNNEGGGTVSIPEFRFGAEAAAKYVNEQLGGVGGRPIEYVRCDTDGSPEKSIDCANKLVEADVVAVQQGTDSGADAAVPILADAGLALVGNSSQGPVQQAAENAFWMGVASPAYGVAPMKFYADRGAESVLFFMIDVPAAHDFIDNAIVPTAEKMGLEFETVYYSPGPDWSVLATAALAKGPDVVGIPAAPEADCTGMVAALRSAGFSGDVYGGVCSAFIPELGDGAVGTHTVSGSWRLGDPDSIPADKQDDVDVYRTAMIAAGHAELTERDSYAVGGFSVTMNLARILAAIDGPIDRASVLAALRATKDFDSFLGPTITCDHTAWPGTSSCGNQMLFYEVVDGGQLSLISDGYVNLAPYAPGA